MSFLKKNGKVLLTVSFCIFIILQQIAVRYRRTYTSRMEMTDENGYDTVALYEINQLEELWRKADVEDLVTPEKMANPKQLELARARLKQAEKGIQESEKRVQGVTGEKHEFFKKAHAYYHHSASVLIDIVDFLLANKGEYSVKENEISFDSENDAARFRELIGKLSYLHQEKQDLDAFILHHNREVEKKLLVR
jgi:hypothetical protein